MENNRFTDTKKLENPIYSLDNFNSRARTAIAHGALTNSKRPECFVKGVYPTHLARGRGCHVWDMPGKTYIDFICGLGTNLLGYSNPEISGAMSQQLSKGTLLSLSTDLEVIAAEKVKELVPWVERIRFLKTGTDACNAALRIARTRTGRSEVLSEGYHGWGDEFVSLTPPALGVVGEYPIRKLVNLDQISQNTAAVIVEPIITDCSRERIEWLKGLREKCTKQGALLIFDEVITGLRFPKFSVSAYYNIKPDLICLGKAIGGGMPLSVVAGKESVMECGEYFVSSTFAGETLSLAAAIKTMTLLQTKYSLEHLWEKGARFLEQFNSIASELIQIEGYPTRGVFKGDPLVKALFWQESCLAGVLFGPSWFFNFNHIDHIDSVINTSKDILTRIKTGSVQLKGELPTSPFAQRVRGQA